MVFDPTFHEISEEADALPDLDGSEAGADEPPFEEVEADALPPLGDQ